MKGALINAGVACATLVAVAGAGELALRASGFSSEPPEVRRVGREIVREPLPGVRYVHEAGASYRQVWPDDPRGAFDDDHGMTYRVNDFGFRGDDFEIARNARLRIAMLGDSFCWGTGIGEEQRFSARVERALDGSVLSGLAVEVYNFCLPGYDTTSEVALYEHVVRHFRPDALLVAYFLNDVNRPGQRFVATRRREPGAWTDWRERSRLFDWVAMRIERRRGSAAYVESVQRAHQAGHPGRRAVSAALARLGELARADAVPTVLAIFPWLARLDADYPFEDAHRAVARAGAAAGLEPLDLLPAFAGRDASELWIHPDDRHPNEIAHAIAADAMQAALAAALERDAEAVLAAAARRRAEALPETLRAAPAKPWYRPFRKLGTRSQ